jgi:hypothetical protein
MQLLGFYDEKTPVYVEAPRPQAVAPSEATVQVLPRPVRSVVASAANRVQELWDTTEISSETLEKWVPGVVARRRLSRNEIRAAHLVWLGLGAALVILLLWLLIARPNAIAAAARSSLDQQAAAALVTIEPLHGLATSLADPTQPDLVESTAAVLDAEATARALFTGAGALGDADDELRARDFAVGSAGEILDASARLSRLVAYRLSAEQALVMVELPASPGDMEPSAAAARVAEWRATVSGIIEELPEGVLSSDKGRLVAWNAELQGWQENFLDAVREGDTAAAEAAVAAQSARIVDLRGQLSGDLAAAGADVGLSLEAAERSLRELLAS